MARGLNKVTLIGIVSRDPEVRHTSAGKRFVSLHVNTTRNWVTSDGERHEETESFDVTAWGSLAEACQRLSAGGRVYITGRVQTRTWDDGRGGRQSSSNVVAGQVLLLSPHRRPSAFEVQAGVNCIEVIGNLGRDPEMRHTAGGKPFSSFTVAASRSWATPSGERREETEWFQVVAWGNLAEICHRQLGRGSRVYIEGRLQTREWEDAAGQKHRRIEVVAEEMIRLGPPAHHGEEIDISRPETLAVSREDSEMRA